MYFKIFYFEFWIPGFPKFYSKINKSKFQLYCNFLLDI